MVEQGGRGGEADYTFQLTRALAEQGWQVELATAEDHRYPPAPGVIPRTVFHYTRGHTILGRVIRRARLGRIVNGLRFLAAVPRLARLSRRVDVVHVQGWEHPPIGAVAVLCMRLTGAPIVQTWHNTFERGGSLRRLNDELRRVLARLTSRTIVHTQADLQRLPAEAVGRTVVIPHGEYGSLARTGGTGDRARARRMLGLADDEPVTLMFGQLRTDKGLDDLLDAVARVPGLRLVIAGEDVGALSASRERLATPELAKRVIVREGFVEMADAAQLFAATDSVVLPYEIASQSGVLLLAYGFRRPVIVYPVGGLVEAVVDGETGWICARPDLDALVVALESSVAGGWSECRRRGESGAQLADERFGWPGIARRTDAVYREVLEASGRAISR